MGKIELLDCTLRDGAYIVDSQFGDNAIKGLISKLQEVGAEVIECGWLKDKPHEVGSSFFHVPDDVIPYFTSKKENTIYSVMIDWDRYNLGNLPSYDGNSINAIRVVFPHGKHVEGMEVGRQIKEKGYKVLFQSANTLAYSDDDLIALAEGANKMKPVALSIVDTFGAMFEEDLERIVSVLDSHLDPDIKLGFHSHNNQQLAFALAIHFIKLFEGKERDIMVDSTLCGMGRGAGNATTELMVSYLNRKCGCHYNLDAVMDAIDIYMGYYQENYKWGYSTPYFIAGMYQCHVNNIAYLLNNHRTNAKDMRNIIQSMDQADRRKYDYDLLEQKYLGIVNRKVDDSLAIEVLSKEFKGREIILVAPGKTAIDDQQRVKQLIAEKQAVVIGVNAILPEYRYDYVFFVNPARYEYAKETSAGFEHSRKILLSNIKAEGDNEVLIIAYDHAVKQGWPHYDNAVICSLRLMDWLGVKKVALVGFDGFKTKYNESYADPLLPSLNPDNKWDELNQEITEMFIDFKNNANYCKEIEFLTESLFNK